MTMESNTEGRNSNQHNFNQGLGFHAQGHRTSEVVQVENLLPELHGSNQFRFSHLTALPNLAQDWKMIEDPNHVGVYQERIMLNGTGPNAKRIHGN